MCLSLKIIGIPSGIVALDKITSGWQKSDLILIAGVPAMGNTSLMVSMLNNIAIKQGIPTAVCTLENSTKALMMRLCINVRDLSRGGILSPLDKLKSTLGEHSEWLKQSIQKEIDEMVIDLETFSLANFVIDDTPGLSVFEIEDRVRSYVNENGIEIVFVDNIELIHYYPDYSLDREKEYAEIMSHLKRLASELNIVIVVFSRLKSKTVSQVKKDGYRPRLNQLLHFTEEALDVVDVICMLHRPEYYGQYTDEYGKNLKGLGQIFVEKNHNNAVGNAWVQFKRKHLRFEDIVD